MDEKTDAIENQEKMLADIDADIIENEYKIFDYFKEHTGLLVACVSAIVATMSFILHFAIGRMNYAYLEYWDFSTIYANTNNQNEVHMLVGAMLFLTSIMLIHWFLSGTSDAFRHYNGLLSAMIFSIREKEKIERQIKTDLDKMTVGLKKLVEKQESNPKTQEVKEKIEHYEKVLNDGINNTKKQKRLMRKLRRWLVLQIVVAVILSYFAGCLFLSLMETTGTIKETIRLSYVIVTVIASDLLLYFLPAYFSTRYSRKKNKDEDVEEIIEKMLDLEWPAFPFQKLFTTTFKQLLTDKKLKLVATNVLIGIVVLLIALPMGAKAGLKNTHSFPIYTDGDTKYAIVYISGMTKFMEEAIINDGSIIIDTTKQRIITTEDILYDVIVFDEVSIIKIDDLEKYKQPLSYVKDGANAIRAYGETILANLEEVTAENEESISGNECEPEAGS